MNSPHSLREGLMEVKNGEKGTLNEHNLQTNYEHFHSWYCVRERKSTIVKLKLRAIAYYTSQSLSNSGYIKFTKKMQKIISFT